MTHEDTETITESTADVGEYIALHIGGNESSKTASGDTIRTKDSEYWFFEVADTTELTREPTLLYDNSGSPRGPVGANSGQAYTRLYDQNGEDILRNDDDDWQVYHFALGIKQEKVRVYPRVPENQTGGGFEYLSGTEPDPEAPSPLGYYRSENLGFEDPSSDLEFFAWREGVLSEHQFGFYNDNNVAVDPLVKLRGRAYSLRPITDEGSILNLMADVGRPYDQQDNEVNVVNWSPVTLRTFSYEVPEEWKDAQNNISIERGNTAEEYDQNADRILGGDR